MQNNLMYSGVTFLLCVSFEVLPLQLARCLTSISSQTIFHDLKVVIIIDGEVNEKTAQIVLDFQSSHPEQVTVLNLEHNIGLGKALNIGLKHVTTSYAARIDPDDIALPERAELQRDYLDQNPMISVVGSFVHLIDQDGGRIGERIYPTDHQAVTNFSKLRSPVAHPAVMLRVKDVIEVGGYPPFRKAQDYALWGLLISRGFNIINLPQHLTEISAGRKLIDRRGLSHYHYELKVLSYLYKIRFLKIHVFLLSVSLRFALRLTYQIFALLRR